jgi:hypothetical protein
MDIKRDKERNVGGRRITARSKKNNFKKKKVVKTLPMEELDRLKYISMLVAPQD